MVFYCSSLRDWSWLSGRFFQGIEQWPRKSCLRDQLRVRWSPLQGIDEESRGDSFKGFIPSLIRTLFFYQESRHTFSRNWPRVWAGFFKELTWCFNGRFLRDWLGVLSRLFKSIGPEPWRYCLRGWPGISTEVFQGISLRDSDQDSRRDISQDWTRGLDGVFKGIDRESHGNFSKGSIMDLGATFPRDLSRVSARLFSSGNPAKSFIRDWPRVWAIFSRGWPGVATEVFFKGLTMECHRNFSEDWSWVSSRFL